MNECRMPPSSPLAHFMHTHTHTHACTHARTHAHTHARTQHTHAGPDQAALPSEAASLKQSMQCESRPAVNQCTASINAAAVNAAAISAAAISAAASMHSQCSSQRAAMISAELRQMPHSAGRGAGHVGKQFGGSQCGVSDQWGSNQRGSNQRGSINARNGNQRCTRHQYLRGAARMLR